MLRRVTAEEVAQAFTHRAAIAYQSAAGPSALGKATGHVPNWKREGLNTIRKRSNEAEASMYRTIATDGCEPVSTLRPPPPAFLICLLPHLSAASQPRRRWIETAHRRNAQSQAGHRRRNQYLLPSAQRARPDRQVHGNVGPRARRDEYWLRS